MTLLPASSAPAPANFSRDLRRAADLTAAATAIAAAAALALSFFALVDRASLNQAADMAEARAQRLTKDIAAARVEAADAPAMGVFAALRDRVNALNALDYGATPPVGGLLDALEATLPDDAILTNIDYDRNKGIADLVAVSARSEELTRLFDVLDGHELFSKVRLLDKKQVAAAGASHTQVNLVLDVGRPSRPAPKTGAAP